MDYFGGDIECIKEKSVSECQQLCQQTDKCAKFSYLTNDFSEENRRTECCLKTDQAISPSHMKGVISGPKECGNLH